MGSGRFVTDTCEYDGVVILFRHFLCGCDLGTSPVYRLGIRTSQWAEHMVRALPELRRQAAVADRAADSRRHVQPHPRQPAHLAQLRVGANIDSAKQWQIHDPQNKARWKS